MKSAIPFQFRSIPSCNSNSNSMACNSNSDSGIGIAINSNSNSGIDPNPGWHWKCSGDWLIVVGSFSHKSNLAEKLGGF